MVIVGGGFGGLAAARGLRSARASVTLIDRANHHLFQPLLYEVATAGLSPADIAMPIRHILRRQRNCQVLLAEVTGVDLEGRRVLIEEGSIPYDFLVLATGAATSYFGNDSWERFAPGLKTLGDATAIRRRILLAFEAAEMAEDPAERASLLTFVIVGGGPTGVELAGAMAELARLSMHTEFRRIDSREARIILLEGGSRLLTSFDESLSAAARAALERMGVEVRTGTRVDEIREDGLYAGGEFLRTQCAIWAAGVRSSPAAQWLGAEQDNAGRTRVKEDLSIPGHETVYVIGDAAHTELDGRALPGIAPVATAQGAYVARAIHARIKGKPALGPFVYTKRPNLATVGRSFAVVEFGRLRFKGWLAWLFWLWLHIFFLIGFANKLLVMLQWTFRYITFAKSARLIVIEHRGDR